MATAPVFKATSGINNVIEPHRLKYGEDGWCPLVSCRNVYVDESGSVSRRKPRKTVVDKKCTSLWSSGNFSFFVSEGSLFRRYKNGSVVLVADSVGAAPLSYAMLMGRVYVCNEVFRAVIDEDNVYPWAESVPTQDPSDSRVLGFPVSFSRCFVHAGRMCLIDGNKLWVGEPYCHGCFDMSAGPLSFATAIGGAVSVKTGIFISDDDVTFFIAGGGRSDFSSMDVVADCPIILGTEVATSPYELAMSEWKGSAAVWVSQDGVFTGMPDGSVSNVTEGRLRFPRILSGAACIHNGYYIFSLEVQE